MKGFKRTFDIRSKRYTQAGIELHELPSIGNLPRVGVPQCRLVVRKLSEIGDEMLILPGFPKLEPTLL